MGSHWGEFQRNSLSRCESVLAVALGNTETVNASADRILPPKYNWNHKGWFQAYDMAAVRRGHQVSMRPRCLSPVMFAGNWSC